MKKLLLLQMFLVMTIKLCAQDCSCRSDFRALRAFMEGNYAGFRDKVNPRTRAAYERFSSAIETKTGKAASPEHCGALMQQWLAWFKDRHVQISRNSFPSDRDTEAFNKRVAETETIQLPEAELGRLEKASYPEGLYYYAPDSSYKVALVRGPSAVRDYAVVVVESKSEAWKPGMVKMELRANGGVLSGVNYFRNHTGGLVRYEYDATSFGGDWQRAGTAKKTLVAPPAVLSSRKLSDSTLYIRIGSFGTGNARAIDSMIRAEEENLATLPFLVLDLRGNGGGADFAYAPLLPYLFTKPVLEIGADVLATEGNTRSWEKLLLRPGLPEAVKAQLQQTVLKMRAGAGRFLSIGFDDTTRFASTKAFPRRIAILVDKGCASTTEQFLLAARQSSKVVLMGTNTAGVLDYSNVRDTAFACFPFTLHYATTRSRRLNMGAGIDNTGIRPGVPLQATQDWISAARMELERGRSKAPRK